MYQMCLERTVMFPSLHQLIRDILEMNEETKAQFFLEPLAFRDVRDDAERTGLQFLKTLNFITRTFVFQLHREYLSYSKRNM